MQSAFKDVAKYSDELEKPVCSDVAIMYDYDSLAAFRIQKQSILLDTQKEMEKFYKAFCDVNVSVDVIPEDADNNLSFGRVIPVGYSDFAGVSVVETESLQDGQEFPVIGHGEFDGQTGEGGVFRDMIEVSDAEVLYTYGDTFYDKFAAVTRKSQGQGMVYYVACSLDEATMKLVMGRIMEDNSIRGEVTEDGVEVCYRGDDSSKIRVVMNHTGEERRYGDAVLAPYESRIDRV